MGKVIKQKVVVEAGGYTFHIKQTEKGKVTVKVAGYKLTYKKFNTLRRVVNALTNFKVSTLDLDDCTSVCIYNDGYVSQRTDNMGVVISTSNVYVTLDKYLSKLMVTNKNENLKIKKLEEEA